MVASVMGKMAVDGYIFQAGSLFHALTDVKTPFTMNATVDIRRSRLSISVSPPASVSTMVLSSALISISGMHNNNNNTVLIEREPLVLPELGAVKKEKKARTVQQQ